jgi:hypothetical protein
VIDAALYLAVRARLAELGHGEDYTWAQNVKPPETPEALVCEHAWVVLNSGMKNAVARVIMDRVWPRLVASLPIGADVFGHRRKVAAIEDTWKRRGWRYVEFLKADEQSAAAVINWCDSLPWIGPITKYHLAKNLGVDCAKPDRWLVRLAEGSGETVEALCARLAAATGDRVATVDVVLWRACAIGVLKVQQGAIKFAER